MNSHELGPKIYYEAPKGRGGGLTPEQEAELFTGKDRDMMYVEKSFVSLVDELKKLEKTKEEKEKGKIRERLQKNWENLMIAQLEETEGVLDNNLLRFRSSYPYDSRTQAMWFESINKAIRKTKREPWVKEESKKWLDRVDIDVMWGESNLRVLEGVGTVLPSFFNWGYMLNWVRERMRTDPIATYYEQAFSEKLPGMYPPEDLGIPLFRSETKEEGKGLRERAIDYQDESTFWRMAVAAVSQADYSKEGEPPTTFMKLDPGEVEFIQKLFLETDTEEDKDGNTIEVPYRQYKGHDVPVSILNWYAAGQTIEKKRRYISTMKALLVSGAKERLGNIIKNKGSMDELVKEIENNVFGRKNEEGEEGEGGLIREWFSRERSLDYRLAAVIVKSGIVLDWGHMSSGRMGWRWEYEENDKGEVSRAVSKGGTTAATDIVTPFYWRSEHSGSEEKNYPGGMFPSMSDTYRKTLRENPPDWKDPELKIEDVKNADPVFRKAWDRLWKAEGEWKWPAEIKESFEKNVWFWETYLEKNGKPIYFPIFFPPEVDSLNFWNTISLSEDKAKKVWQELSQGERLSQLNWEKMGDQALYRWMITIGQTNRFLTVMLEPETKANEGQFIDFFADPSKITELFKRVKLGVRDEIEPSKDLTLALAPMLIILKSADKFGIIGEAGKDEKIRTMWAGEIAKWKARAAGLSEKDYANGFSRLIQFYFTLVARIGFVAGDEEDRKAQEELKEIRTTLKGDAGINISPLVIDTKPELR
jgi:hypothetical protein